MYLIAFIPPVAVLLCGKPGQALLSVVLTACGYVPGLIHAWFVAANYYADKRTDRLIKDQRRNTAALIGAQQRQAAQPRP